MLADYWGFETTPFRNPAGAGFFQSASNDEALARLQFLVDNRYRLGILLGESGSGKTVLLQRFQYDLHRTESQVCRFSLLGIDVEEFLQQINAQLCLSEGVSLAEVWQNLFDHICVNGYQNVPTVFLFDDVHEAEGEVLTAVARLTQAVSCANQRFTIFAAADALRAELVGRRLIELATLRVELWPWTQVETAEFIQNEIRRCGRSEPAFDVQALDRIFEISGGNPRQICLLAELALAAGVGQTLPMIDAETIESVSEELQMVHGSAMA